MPFPKKTILLQCVILFTLTSNNRTEAKEDQTPERNSQEVKLIENLYNEIEQKKIELNGLQKIPTEKISSDDQKRIKELNNEIKRLNKDFEKTASGYDSEDWNPPEQEEKPTLGDAFNEFAAPLVTMLIESSEGLRITEALNKRKRRLTEQLAEMKDALKELETKHALASEKKLNSVLKKMVLDTGEKIKNTAAEIQAVNKQLRDLEKNTPGIWKRFKSFSIKFIQGKGITLLIVLLSVLICVSLLRLLHKFIKNRLPRSKNEALVVQRRVIELSLVFLKVLLPIIVIILILYLRNDWILLTLFILALGGILWGIKDRVPNFLQQIELILNLGPVREGERIILDGIPWEVRSLSLDSILVNPALTGGIIRVEAETLIGYRSRPFDKKEPWFPTMLGDWIRIQGDDSEPIIGKVIQQSPEQVHVIQLGGMRRIYPTAHFIALTPDNLSMNFRINCTFGLDYKHQKMATTEIPQKLQEYLLFQLNEKVGHDNLKSLNVEFKQAAASSLDYSIIADFSGECASSYKALTRVIHQACVELANTEGWTIPFTQITIHKADIGSKELAT